MKTLTIFNQKGGVGKTTSTINIASYYAMKGYKVLLIDTDPQSNLTESMGVTNHDKIPNIVNLYKKEGEIDPGELITTCSYEYNDNDSANDKSFSLDLIPSTNGLASVEISGGSATMSYSIDIALQKYKENDTYDFVFIDPPPSLAILSMNALVAADYVLVPVQAEYYALRGLSALIEAYQKVTKRLNENLDILGFFLTMVDLRTNLADNVEKNLRNNMSREVFQTKIRRNIKLSEATGKHQPIYIYRKNSNGAEDYKKLSEEVLVRVQEKQQ